MGSPSYPGESDKCPLLQHASRLLLSRGKHFGIAEAVAPRKLRTGLSIIQCLGHKPVDHISTVGVLMT